MPVIIKRYRNRKLYNTRSRRYITLEQIEELIKEQEEVKVIDNTSGEDITAATLSQIIFELEKSQASFLPLNLLVSLVRSGGERIDELRRNIFNTLNLVHHYDVEIERRVNQLVDDGELSPILGAEIMEKLLRVGYRRDGREDLIEDRIIDILRQRQIPTKTDFRSLIDKIDHLSKRVETINSSDAER